MCSCPSVQEAHYQHVVAPDIDPVQVNPPSLDGLQELMGGRGEVLGKSGIPGNDSDTSRRPRMFRIQGAQENGTLEVPYPSFHRFLASNGNRGFVQEKVVGSPGNQRVKMCFNTSAVAEFEDGGVTITG